MNSINYLSINNSSIKSLWLVVDWWKSWLPSCPCLALPQINQTFWFDLLAPRGEREEMKPNQSLHQIEGWWRLIGFTSLSFSKLHSLPSTPSIHLSLIGELIGLLKRSWVCSFLWAGLVFLLKKVGYGPEATKPGSPKRSKVCFCFIKESWKNEGREGWWGWLASKPITHYSVIWKSWFSMEEAINFTNQPSFLHSTKIK